MHGVSVCVCIYMCAWMGVQVMHMQVYVEARC